MKVICYALCFVLLVFPLAACQDSAASDPPASDASYIADADFSVIDGSQSKSTIMGKVTAIDGYTVTIETMGFGFPRQAGIENLPELPENFDGFMSEMPEMPDIPDMQEPGEAPEMSRANPPDAENMMEAPEKGGMPFEKEGFGENREFDFENAEVFIENQNGTVSGSVDDIEVDSVLSIELDENSSAVKVIILSDMGGFKENAAPIGEVPENNSDAE